MSTKDASISETAGYQSAEAAAQAYVDARGRGDTRGLRAAFHPAARLQWVDDAGSLMVLTQLAWWQRFRDKSPGQGVTSNEIHVIDRDGPLALVEVVLRFTDFGFHDYLLIVDTGAGWRIVDKISRRLTPGEALGGLSPEDGDAVRAALALKIEAHAGFDPALLDASHVPECRYHKVRVGGVPYTSESLSEAAALYAERKDRGETGKDSQWRVLSVVGSGAVAAAKLDVIYKGERFVDHLLLLRVGGAWRIVAAAWGPSPAGAE